MSVPTHQGLYRNTPLVAGGLLGAIALLIGGVAAALQIAATSDELLPLIFGTLGAFVLTFVVCMLAALRRHRWTIEPNAVLIEERPLVPLTGRRRTRRVPFREIAALSNVQNAAEDLLVLATREGERFLLPPGPATGEGLIRKLDQESLTGFAGQLQTAMNAAGHAAPPMTDGLGFWNRPAGLALLGATLMLSLGLAGAVVWALFEGATIRHRGGEAVAILVMMPLGVAWMLRRAWRRRRAVMRMMSDAQAIPH